MIVEERTYILSAKYALGDYLEPYQREGLPVQVMHLGQPIGAFTTEVGDLHSLVSMWRYESFEDRANRRAQLASDRRWQECLLVIRPMIQSMKNRILIPTNYSPLR